MRPFQGGQFGVRSGRSNGRASSAVVTLVIHQLRGVVYAGCVLLVEDEG